MIIFIIWLTLFLVCFVHIHLFCVNLFFIFTKSGLEQQCDKCWYFFQIVCRNKESLLVAWFALYYFELNIYIKHVFVVFKTVAINVYHHFVPFLFDFSLFYFLLQDLCWVNIKIVISGNHFEYIWWTIFPLNITEWRPYYRVLWVYGV